MVKTTANTNNPPMSPPTIAPVKSLSSDAMTDAMTKAHTLHAYHMISYTISLYTGKSIILYIYKGWYVVDDTEMRLLSQ